MILPGIQTVSIIVIHEHSILPGQGSDFNQSPSPLFIGRYSFLLAFIRSYQILEWGANDPDTDVCKNTEI